MRSRIWPNLAGDICFRAQPGGAKYREARCRDCCAAGGRALAVIEGRRILRLWPQSQDLDGRPRSARPAPYATAFRTALEKAGYKVITPGQDNLFDPGANAADYEAAAVITDERIDGCVGYFDTDAIWGDNSMTVSKNK